MPAVDLKWGTLAKVGGADKRPIEMIESHHGSSDGPSIGISAGDISIQIHAEDALRFASMLIEVAGLSLKRYGSHQWRWPD